MTNNPLNFQRNDNNNTFNTKSWYMHYEFTVIDTSNIFVTKNVKLIFWISIE